MGTNATESDAGEDAAEDVATSRESTDTSSESPQRSPTSTGLSPGVSRGEDPGITQRSAAPGTTQSPTARADHSANNYVNFDQGPDHAQLSHRYGMDIQSGQGSKLQRLEQEHGPHTVMRWASEGMTVDTMGKPRDMRAFRKRQAGRSGEIPRDVERRNEASVHRNANASSQDSPAGDSGVPDSVRSVVSSPGKSLDEPVQREMESKMGDSFSDVRIHTGPDAAAAADSINARAFTVGNHVAFNRGEYNPGSDSGKEVIAHELTHVRQQTGGAVSMLPAEGLEIDPDPGLEREAEETAQAVTDADKQTVQRLGCEMHVQRLPSTETVEGQTDSPVLQRDSAAATAETSENVAKTIQVEKGDDIVTLADEHDIDNWRNLWYQNHDEIGDQPYLLFPRQRLEIPEDEDAVPDLDLPEPEGEPTPAPANDMRDEEPEKTPPKAELEEGEEAENVEEDDEIEDKIEEKDQKEDPETEGPTSLTVESGEPREITDVPASADESPSTPAADTGLQGTLGAIDSGVGELVEGDTTTESGEARENALSDNAREASEKPSEEDEGEDETEHLSILDEEQAAVPDFDKEEFKGTMESRVEEITPDHIEELDAFNDDDPTDELQDEMEDELEEEQDSTVGDFEDEAEAEPPDTPDEEESVELDEAEMDEELDLDEDAASSTRPDPQSEQDVEDPMDDVQQDLQEPLENSEFDEEDMAASPHEEIREPAEESMEIQAAAEDTATDYRDFEREQLTGAEAEQSRNLDQGVEDVNETREMELQNVAQDQREAKSDDEQAREEIFSKVNSIYDRTQERVEDRLTAMDDRVEEILTEDVKEVREQFKEDVEEAKDKSTGFGSWVKRTFFLGDDMNENFEEARQKFIDNMHVHVINKVADVVARGMEEVGDIIIEGRQEIDDYLSSLPEERREVAQEAAQQMNEKFQGLREGATERAQNIQDDVVETYEENLEEIEDELAEAKEEVEAQRWSFKPGFVEALEDIWEAMDMVQAAAQNIGETAPTPQEVLDSDFGTILSGIQDMFDTVFDHFMDIGNLLKTMVIALLKWLQFDDVVDDWDEISLPESLTDLDGMVAMGWDLFKGFIAGDYIKDRIKSVWGGEGFRAKGETHKYSEAFTEVLGLGMDIADGLSDALGSIGDQHGDELMRLAEGVGYFGLSLVNWSAAGLQRAGSILIDSIAELWGDHLLSTVLDEAVKFLADKMLDVALKKLKALAGPVGGALKLINKTLDFTEFLINNIGRYVGIIQGVIQGFFGIIRGSGERAAMQVIDVITEFLPLLFDLIASLFAGSGVGEDLRAIFDSTKDTLDDFFDSAIERLEPVLKPLTEKLYPMFFLEFGSEEEEEGSEEGSEDGAQDGGQDGGEASDQDTDSSDTDQTVMHDIADDLDDLTGDDVDLDSLELEDKMFAVDKTVVAEQGNLDTSGANQVLKAAGLYDMVMEHPINRVEFVTQRTHEIRQALLGDIAGELDPDQIEEDLDDGEAIQPEHVWENGEWKIEYQTMAGQVAEQHVEETVEQRQEQREQEREDARDEMARHIAEQSSEDLDVEEIREDFEYMSDDEIEAVTGLTPEGLRNQAAVRERQHREAAFHAVRANPHFQSDGLTDEEIYQEVQDMDEDQLEAITGQSMDADIAEVMQNVDQTAGQYERPDVPDRDPVEMRREAAFHTVRANEELQSEGISDEDLYQEIQDMDEDQIEEITGLADANRKEIESFIDEIVSQY